MLRLNIKTEAYELDLGMGVKVKVKPCTSAVFYQARAYMNEKLHKLGDEYKALKEVGVKNNDLPDLENSTVREALAEQYLTLGLAIAGIIEWEGILEADSDEKAPLTEEKIAELFGAYWVIAETFRQKYTGMKELLEAEKNVLSASPNGTSETAQNTAKTALKKEDNRKEKA